MSTLRKLPIVVELVWVLCNAILGLGDDFNVDKDRLDMFSETR